MTPKVQPRVIDFRDRPQVKIYRRHNCNRKHRNETTFMACALGKKLNWITGVGRYASISWCNGRRHRNHYVTVVLAESLEGAMNAKAEIDYIACGGGCERRHQVVRVDLATQ